MSKTFGNVHRIECLPVTVIFIGVVTSKRGKKSKTNCVGEENLSTSIHPHLKWSIKPNVFVCLCVCASGYESNVRYS